MSILYVTHKIYNYTFEFEAHDFVDSNVDWMDGCTKNRFNGSCEKSFPWINIFVRSSISNTAKNGSPTVWRSTREASASFPVGQREGATPRGRRTRRRSIYRPEAYPSSLIRELTLGSRPTTIAAVTGKLCARQRLS